MSRHIYIIGILSLLTACGPTLSQREALPVDEVMQNAAQKSTSLTSAGYTIDGSFSLSHIGSSQTHGDFTLVGTLQDSGEKIAFALKTDAKHNAADLQASVDVVITGPDDVYLRANSWTGLLAQTLFRQDLLKEFLGTWWHLPREDVGSRSVRVTPDPRLLQAQAQVVRVTAERGFATVRGHECYRYDIELDSEKLVAYLAQLAQANGQEFDAESMQESIDSIDAKGQLWIDADAFIIHKLQWTLSLPITDGLQTLTLSAIVDVFDHNEAEHIEPPTDAKEFSPMQFIGTPIPLNTEPIDPSLVEDDILEKLLEEGAANPYPDQFGP